MNKFEETYSVFIENYTGTLIPRVLSSFDSLPEAPPRGFWVTPTGTFAIVPEKNMHDRVAIELFPKITKGALEYSPRLLDNMLLAGFAKMDRGPEAYEILAKRKIVSPSTIQLAKDLAKFYNKEADVLI